ncbi:oxidoreductase-like domain-containing protein 1 [Montipora foliosa]|uniref:oxidoreductase-like domain-containing protein 1 n=1 Tax=Montipora foliosa TaxID=591990 RepID=UPI0035F1B091
MLRSFRPKLRGNALFRLPTVRTQQVVCHFSVSNRRTCDESTQQAVLQAPNKSNHNGNSKKNVPLSHPPPPLELCCMSGCQNCVMIQHAEELLKLYEDDSAARAAIDEMPDENLKAFLKIELNLK